MSVRQGLSLVVLGAIHLTFLITLLLDHNDLVRKVLWVKLFILVSMILVIDAYVRAPRTAATHPKSETLLYPFIIAFAAILTYFVSAGLHLGPVIASAGIGFIASYLTLFKSSFIKTLPTPIYCGTFVGMCSSFLAEDYFFVAYAGLVAGLIYTVTRDALNGIGGKLGTIAFGGVVIVSLIFSLL